LAAYVALVSLASIICCLWMVLRKRWGRFDKADCSSLYLSLIWFRDDWVLNELWRRFLNLMFQLKLSIYHMYVNTYP
jgi:hypothetical protein